VTKKRLFAAWYFAIGAGFFLLGLNQLIAGGTWWAIGLRWAVAAGFVLLGFVTLR